MRTEYYVCKYLNSYVIDRIILTDFDPVTLNDIWKNYTPKVNYDNVTAFNQSVELSSVIADTPIELELEETRRLDDRESIELDLLISSPLEVGQLELGFYETINSNTPKLLLTNSVSIPANKIVTVKFDFNNNTSTLSKAKYYLGSIKGIKINIKVDQTKVIIAKVNTYASNYQFTIEEVTKFYDSGLKYVLSSLGRNELPNSNIILEAVYIATAAYVVLEKDNSKNSKNKYSLMLFNDADRKIEEYMNGGSTSTPDHPRMKLIGGYVRSDP